MTIDLKAIRERDAKQARMPTLHLKCGHDRAQLLALVDRMREPLDEWLKLFQLLHERIDLDTWSDGHEVLDRTVKAWDQVVALMRDLDGDARGGGR